MVDEDRSVFGSDYHSYDNHDYNPCSEDEASDAYTSDAVGYDEEGDGNFMDGQRTKRQSLQLHAFCADEYQSEYVDSEDEVIIPYSSDEEDDNMRPTHGGLWHDPHCPIEMIKFQVGMKFASPSEFKAAMKNYAIAKGFNVRMVRSSNKEIEYKCIKDCPWRIYASWDYSNVSFVVKTLNNSHMCSRALQNRQLNYRWLAEHFLDTFRTNINWKVTDMMREVKEQFGLKVPKQMCYRARTAARNIIEGTFEEAEGDYVLPPFVSKQRGRPRLKRKIDNSEVEPTTRLSKRGMQIRCSICHQVGHNRRKCGQKRVEQTGEESAGGTAERIHVQEDHA